MKYLVDTQVFLWWLNNDKGLKPSIKTILTDPKNTIFVSVVSAWEISIKLSNKRLKLKTTIGDCFQKACFEILEIKLPHVLHLSKLASHHKDPFDRMLIAQALVEKARLITKDPKVLKYNASVLKA